MTIDSGCGWSTTQQYVAFSRTELVPHDNICFCSTKSRFDRSELIDFITLFAGHARRLIYFSLPIGFDFFYYINAHQNLLNNTPANETNILAVGTRTWI
jgi:hypothetical protein